MRILLLFVIFYLFTIDVGEARGGCLLGLWCFKKGNHVQKKAPPMPCEFEFYDLNVDEVVSRDEMQQVSSGFRHLADSQEVDVLAAMDSDANGTVTKAEFLENLHRLQVAGIVAKGCSSQ